MKGGIGEERKEEKLCSICKISEKVIKICILEKSIIIEEGDLIFHNYNKNTTTISQI